MQLHHIIGTVASSIPAGGAVPSGADFLITVPANKVSDTLTDFPLMVDLADMPSEFWVAVTSDGGNVRAYGADGTSPLPLDITTLDGSAETGRLFVKTTLLSDADNYVVLKVLGQEVTALPVTDPLGRNAVWLDYEAVWVFPDTANRTGAGAPEGYAQDLSDFEAVGPLGDWRRLSGNTAWGSFPRQTTWTATVSVVWDETSGDKQMAFIGVTDPDNPYVGNRAGLLYDEGPDVIATWSLSDSWAATSIGLSYQDERRLALSYSGTVERAIFVDGVKEVSDGPVTERPAGAGTDTAFILNGTDLGVGESGNAFYQYAWFRNEAMSEAWMAADAANMNAPSAFYTVSLGSDPLTDPWTLDPATIGSSHTLSNDNMTLTNTFGTSDYRHTANTAKRFGPDAGLVYWELEMIAGGPTTYSSYAPILDGGTVPINSADNPINGANIGRRGNGTLWTQGSQQVSGLLPFGAGDTVMIALDAATGDVWTGVNGTWDHDPSVDLPTYSPASPNGSYALGAQARDPASGMTLLTTATQVKYAVPAGAILPGDYVAPDGIKVTDSPTYAVSGPPRNSAIMRHANTYVVIQE